MIWKINKTEDGLWEVRKGKQFLQENLCTGKIRAIYKPTSIDCAYLWYTEEGAQSALDKYLKTKEQNYE